MSASIPTFSSFEIGKSGLRSSQLSINVAAHNMANANTPGFTRQRTDIVSMSYGSTSAKYRMYGQQPRGLGSDVKHVSQIRDPFLDRRFRDNFCQVGEYSIMKSAYDDLETALADMKVDGLNESFNQLKSAMQSYTDETTSVELAGIVRDNADRLAALFNTLSREVQTIKEQQIHDLSKVEVQSINTKLSELAYLNQQIRNFNSNGAEPLELMDARNLLLDELSMQLDIEVQERPVDIGQNITVFEMDVKLKNPTSTGEDIYLVSDQYCAQFLINALPPGDVPVSELVEDGLRLSVVNCPVPPAPPERSPGPDDREILDFEVFNSETPQESLIGSGTIKGYFSIIYDAGSFGTDTDTRGISYYEQSLDLLANEFASYMNNINNQSAGSDLFVSTDNSQIKASNISISQEWRDDPFTLVTTDTTIDGSPNGQTDVLLKFIKAFSDKVEFTGTDEGGGSFPLFTGSFTEFMTDMCDKLGLDTEKITAMLDAAESTSNTILDSRDSISGVSLDEETVNLMNYQKAYNAAARIITTLDEMLDVIINKMGVVGR